MPWRALRKSGAGLAAVLFFGSGLTRGSELALATDSKPTLAFETPLVAGIERAGFTFWVPERVVGVLVLLDGENLPATALTGDADWREFAREHDLALCGAEFVSPERALREERGYYAVEEGAGETLLGALDRAGLGGKPLLLYGISGGARFVNGFLAWRPERVRAWSAYATSLWVPPVAGRSLPPGIVACGQYDDGRYAAGLKFVQQARALGQPVAWVSLEALGHRRSLELEDFTREFFAVVLRAEPGDRPVAVDLVKEVEMRPVAPWEFLLSGALPSRRLVKSWAELHDP